MERSGGNSNGPGGSGNSIGARRFSWQTLVAVAVIATLLTAAGMFITMREIGPSPTQLEALATETQTVLVTIRPTLTAEPATTKTVTVAPETTQAANVPAEEDGATPEAPQGWVNLDMTITTPDDLADLPDAPAGFKDYLASYVGQEDDWGCITQVDVWAMHPDGFAYGSEWAEGCGGSQYIWADIFGWGTVFSTQDMFKCAELEAAGLPYDVGSGLDCYDGEDVYIY